MKKKRKLFQTAGGIGNQIQLLPAYLYFQKKHRNLDIVYVHMTDSDNEDKAQFWRIFAASRGNHIHLVRRHQTLAFDQNVYDGIIACRHQYFQHNLVQELVQMQPHTGNEVDYNNQCMRASTALRIMTEELPFDWMDVRKKAKRHNVGRELYREQFDVVLCNGGLNNIVWAKKKYQRWNEVAEILKAKGLTVACVGTADEYIQGCIDRTDIGVVPTMDIISQAKVLGSNDSGWAHFACAAGVRTVIAYTATNIVKNWNLYFHAMGWVVQPECEHFPCQADWHLGDRWTTCEDWKCTYYDPNRIAEYIEMGLA